MAVTAQDTTGPQHKPSLMPDTAGKTHPQKRGVGNMAAPDRKKPEYFKDTVRRQRRKFDSTLFTNVTVPSTSDYAEELVKVYQLLGKVPGVTSSFVKLQAIHDYMGGEDSALDIIKEKMFQSDQTFNIRNLQTINMLLDALDRNTTYYSRYLEQYDTALDGVRQEIATMQKDTLMIRIFRDTALQSDFQPQLQQLKSKWRQVDSLVGENGKEINTLKSQVSAHSITIGELLYRVDMELKALGSEAFEKERRYLWEPRTVDEHYSQDSFKDSFWSEVQMARIYFSNTSSRRLWLIVIGFIFFYWVWQNFRTLKRLEKLPSIENFKIGYINPYPVAASLIFMLNLAPLFDLHAPSIYFELIQFLLMVVVTFVLRKRLIPSLFYAWCIFIFLFLLLLLTRIIGLPLNLQRWVNLFIDSASFAFSLYFLLHQGKKYGKWIFFAVGLYMLFNLLAVICNLMGRVTLTQILSYTAVYSLAQTVGLGIFVKVILESFLLQIQTSRIRKEYPEGFNHGAISKSIQNFSMILAIVLWLIVFATNLNLFDALNDFLTDIFTSTREVGNFSFTFGGIALFLGIIWLANFLQKYIAYFFGDTGDDAAFDDKGQRSRLMVTRLILLIAGFLLAVAASGLAVDRITVILGALGVGIGLGLQSIVNNFVSGVILIFDRPLRIGDTVDIGDKRGRVKEIGIRTSTLLTEEGAEVIIPNGDILAHNIINWTLSDNHVRQDITFTIDKPPNRDVIEPEAIKELVLKNHNVIEHRDPEILINTINAKTLELKVFFWIKDFNISSQTLTELKAAIYQHLEQKGLTVV
ncbi:MAG: mechanosensitive ion channel [Bacteroidota bacterium]|nr:mechanosensitive ion channel [Bacteroidota bacterium]